MKNIIILLTAMLSFGMMKAQDEVIKMTTDQAPGGKIQLIIHCEKADSSSIWIDLNNNAKKDEGEGSLGLTFPDNNLVIAQYTIESNEIAIYGKVRGINILKNSITSLDVSACNTLTKLVVLNNLIKQIDLSKNINLVDFSISDNMIQSIDLSNNPKLKSVVVTSSNLKNIIFIDKPIINFLDLRQNLFSKLDITKLTELEELVLRDNLQLKSIDLSKNTKLERLDIMNTRLTELNLANNPLLKILYAPYTNLSEELDLSKNIKLYNLDVSHGQLKKLILPQSDSLTYIKFAYNQIEEVIYHKYPLAKSIFCESNKIKSINFEGWDSVKHIQCFGNEITGEESSKLLTSLKDRATTSEGKIFFISTTVVNNDKNSANKKDVANAKLKNWKVMNYPKDDYIGIDPTGVVNENDNTFLLFPNPAGDYLNIKEIENVSGDIEIYSLTGEKLLQCSSTAKIDIRTLPAGIYYAKINGKMEKIVKK